MRILFRTHHSMCQIKSFKDAKWHVEGGECVWPPPALRHPPALSPPPELSHCRRRESERKWPTQGGEKDATTTTAECNGNGRFVVVSSSSDVCRKDDRPAGEVPRARKRTTMEMNDNNKDDDRRSLSSQLGNGSKRTRREHEERAMDMHTTIKQITRRGG